MLKRKLIISDKSQYNKPHYTYFPIIKEYKQDLLNKGLKNSLAYEFLYDLNKFVNYLSKFLNLVVKWDERPEYFDVYGKPIKNFIDKNKVGVKYSVTVSTRRRNSLAYGAVMGYLPAINTYDSKIFINVIRKYNCVKIEFMFLPNQVLNNDSSMVDFIKETTFECLV